MSQIINYGIVGCGMMGQEHLKNIALLPDTTIAGIYEPDGQMARKAQELAPDAHLVNSLCELLAIDALDCLVIVSPNHCHVAQLAEIQATRPLPILVEKPLFTSPSDLEKLQKFRVSYPAPVWVAMEYRYMPPIAAFLDNIDMATGGVKMLTIREHRFPFLPKVGDWNRFNKNTGGTFVEKCCHFFDLMCLVMKSNPVRIMASAGQAVNHLTESYDGQVPDVLDNGFVIVDFANGNRAMLELCMFAEGSRYQEEISAVGPDGKIEALVPGPGRFWPTYLGDAPMPQLVISPRAPKGPTVQNIPVDTALLEAGDHNGATFYQHKGFLDLVRGDRAAPEVSVQDGLVAAAMGLAAQQSASSGQSIDLTKGGWEILFN